MNVSHSDFANADWIGEVVMPLISNLTHPYYNMNMTEPAPITKPYKIPRSTLIIIYTPQAEVLLIERADKIGYWQSVTGSQDAEESLAETAAREVGEETGLIAGSYRLTDWQQKNVYEIFPIWRHRYAPGVTENVEHVFGLEVPSRVPIKLAPREHLQHVWLPHDKAAALCFSPTNRDAILSLPARISAAEQK
jgi:dihydroneopterin triphosphate diphosphatase